MKNVLWLVTLSLCFFLMGCSSVKTCQPEESSLNYSTQSGPVCQMQPGHEPNSPQGFPSSMVNPNMTP